MYKVVLSNEAVRGAAELRKSAASSFKKLSKLIYELREHPYTGTGHPEQLRYLPGVWSRHIDKKNRLRYMVNDNVVLVSVISVIGHYNDK